MKRKKILSKSYKESLPQLTNVDLDLSQYNIIKGENGHWGAKVFRLYGGELKECIVEFEKKYGKIDGKIYYDEKAKLVGITGSNVLPNIERTIKEFHS